MEYMAAILGATAIFLMSLYVIRARAMRPGEARLQALNSTRDVVVETDEEGRPILRRSASSIPALSRMLSARGYAQRWSVDLERAGLTLRPGEYFMIRIILAMMTVAIVTLIGRNAAAFFVSLLLGAIVFMLPAVWLRIRVRSRINKINSQLVETITLIASAQRAGFAFAQGVDVAAKRVGPPMSTELNRMLLDINLGASTESALQAMNSRIQSDDVDMVVTAILIQRQTGGNLSEVLDNVTETMRDRERIYGEIKTLTASQRFTGWVLSLWPAALALAFFLIAPSIMSLLWTTGAGLVLVGIWLVLNLLGIFSIQRILDIDV